MFISLDLSKACDRMSCERLLHTMHLLGFSMTSQKLIASYLADRVIYTQVGPERAGPFRPMHGGPQGSVLLPLLYIIYMQPMIDNLREEGSCTPTAFVDDLMLYIPSNSDSRLNAATL